jgi:hypothetical protein
LKVSKKNPRASANFFGRNSFTPSRTNGFELLLRGFRMASRLGGAGRDILYRHPVTPGIAVIRRIDVVPPAYTPAFIHDRVASPDASARDFVRRSRNLLSTSGRCDFSTVPGLTRWYYRKNS